MKIAVLTLDFPPQVGGVQTYLYEISRRLGETHKVGIVTPVKGQLPPAVPLQKITLSHGNAFRFWQALRATQPDRVLVGHAHPQLLLPAAVYTRNHHLTIAHGNDYLAAQQRWHRLLFNWLLSHSRQLVTHTQANAQHLKRLGLPDACVVYPGTDPTWFTPPIAPAPFPPVLLTVGRLVARKGIDTVLYALPPLLSSYPDLRYHIVGDGPDRARLQALAQALRITPSVIFSGEVDHVQLLTAYQQAHIFVMPVREEEKGTSVEGFGIVYLEASACGLPVIAGRSGGASEAVRHEHTGYLVAPNAPEAVARVVLNLLENPERRQQMGQNGRRWVEKEMNWDRAARRLLLLLTSERPLRPATGGRA